MENQLLQPTEAEQMLAFKSQELAMMQTNRARLVSELSEAEKYHAKSRFLVKTGNAAAHELTQPQSEITNLRVIVAELDTEIPALENEIISIKAEIKDAATLGTLRACAVRADEAAARIHLINQRAAIALQPYQDEWREAQKEFNSARADLREIALPEIAKRPRDSSIASAYDAKIEHATDLLHEVSEDGTSIRNVWGALPHDRPFTGGDLPQSDVEVTAPLARAVAEMFAQNGSVQV